LIKKLEPTEPLRSTAQCTVYYTVHTSYNICLLDCGVNLGAQLKMIIMIWWELFAWRISKAVSEAIL